MIVKLGYKNYIATRYLYHRSDGYQRSDRYEK